MDNLREGGGVWTNSEKGGVWTNSGRSERVGSEREGEGGEVMPRRRKDGNSDHGTGAITADYRGRTLLDDTFRVTNFSMATYVRGQTLERFWHRPDLNKSEDSTVQYFLVYRATPRQMADGCDRCVTHHRPTNLACSKTKAKTNPGIQTPCTDETLL